MVSTTASFYRRGNSAPPTRPDKGHFLKETLIEGPGADIIPIGRGRIDADSGSPTTRLLGAKEAPLLSDSALARRHDLRSIPPTGLTELQWGTPERLWMWRLSGLECGPELFHLYLKDRRLAGIYEQAVRAYVDMAGADSRRDFEADLYRVGRKAVYDAEKIILEARGETANSNDWPLFPPAVRNILERPELFDILTHGHLRETLLNAFLGRRYREGLDGDPTIRISSDRRESRIGEPVCQVAIESGQLSGIMFLKVSSIRPDIFAADLFYGTDMVLPDMRNISYFHPQGFDMDYGMLKHLASGDGIIAGASISHLRDEPLLAGRLRSGFRELTEKLGYAFELCRMRGIQDRHPGNVWLLMNNDFRLSIAMIDLDLVGCYPYDSEKYMGEFASRLRAISLDIYRILFIGGSSERDCAMEALGMLYSGFLRGAQRANEEDTFRARHIRGIFAGHDGLPVGIYIRPIYILQKFEHLGGWPVTFNPINGPERQKLFLSTPESGRITFDADAAWRHGYLRQRAIPPVLFWKHVFDMARNECNDSIVY